MKAFLVDDEPLLVEHLKNQLHQLWPSLEITGVAYSARQASRLLASDTPDVMFLDIHMPGMSGLELAAQLPSNVRLVFVTAYDQHAIEAFKNAAVDYVLKPVALDRLKLTVDRLQAQPVQARDDLAQLLTQLAAKHREYLQWLKSTQGETTNLISIDEVIFFKSSQKYTEVFTRDRNYLVRQSLSELERELDPTVFWRIHRGMLVRVDQIASATKELSGRFSLSLKDRSDRLVCSKRYGHLFRQS